MTVVFYTRAYNAEKTLPRAIQSILTQTVSNWVWHLVDNGSTDKTEEIIRSLAAIDLRIIPHRNKQNNVVEPGNLWEDIIVDYDDSDYYCALDADDEYKPDFLEKMLSFINENNLDIAACGSDFINEVTNGIWGVRKTNQDIILTTPEEFDVYFAEYHPFMRTMWGKLYKISVMRFWHRSCAPKIDYGLDTLCAIGVFRNVARIGILEESLHKYYVSPKSTSYRWDNRRIESDRILHKAAYDFLIEKCSKISQENERFLSGVYFNATIETINVLIQTTQPFIEKVRSINDILSYSITHKLFHGVAESEQDARFRLPILKWLLAQNKTCSNDVPEMISGLLMNMYEELSSLIKKDSLSYIIAKMPEIVEPLIKKDHTKVLERINTWLKRHGTDAPLFAGLQIALYRALNKPDHELFDLLAHIKKAGCSSSMEEEIEGQIVEIIDKYPLMKDLGVNLTCVFSRVVSHIMEGNYVKALDGFLSALDHLEISEGDFEQCIVFARNLSASAEDSGAYIHFSKIWLSFLIDSSRNDEACQEIEDFIKILPNDEDFIALKERIIVK